MWLVTADIIDEYKAVLRRLHVRPALIGTIVNLLPEEAELVKSAGLIEAEPDPGDTLLGMRRGRPCRFHRYVEPEGFPAKQTHGEGHHRRRYASIWKPSSPNARVSPKADLKRAPKYLCPKSRRPCVLARVAPGISTLGRRSERRAQGQSGRRSQWRWVRLQAVRKRAVPRTPSPVPVVRRR